MAIILVADFLNELNLDSTPQHERLYTTSKSLLDAYCSTADVSNAEDDLYSEALVRLGGYLARNRHRSDIGVAKRQVDDFMISFDFKNTSALERSGAMAIIGTFVPRRLGSTEE